MKIETWLQPNCSESVVSIVDWNGKQVIDSYDASSDKHNDTAVSELKAFLEYIKAGYEVNINSNGDHFTSTIYDAAKKIHDQNLEIDESKWEQLVHDLGNNSATDLSLYQDKLKAFAEGKFKGGKHAIRKASSR